MPERVVVCLVLAAVRGVLSHTKRPHNVERCLVLCKICTMTLPLDLLVVIPLPVPTHSIRCGNFLYPIRHLIEVVTKYVA